MEHVTCVLEAQGAAFVSGLESLLNIADLYFLVHSSPDPASLAVSQNGAGHKLT